MGFTTYTTSNSGLASNNVQGVAVTGTTIYAATDNGLSRGSQGEGTFAWTTCTTTNGLASNDVKSVALGVSGSIIGAAITGCGVSVSINGGSSWTNYTSGLGERQCERRHGLGYHPLCRYQRRPMVGTLSGTTYSWTNYTAAAGLANSYVDGVAASGSTIYAATGGGLSVSTTGGSSWTTTYLEGNVVYCVAVSDSTIAVVTDNGLAMSPPAARTGPPTPPTTAWRATMCKAWRYRVPPSMLQPIAAFRCAQTAAQAGPPTPPTTAWRAITCKAWRYRVPPSMPRPPAACRCRNKGNQPPGDDLSPGGLSAITTWDAQGRGRAHGAVSPCPSAIESLP